MEFGATAITIGTVQIRYYGIIIVAAILVGAFLADRLAREDKRDPDHVWGALFWAVILGIVFARLWYILFPPISQTVGCGIDGGFCRDTAWYFENFFDLQSGAVAIWSGGLHIFGAFIGGFMGSAMYLRVNGEPLLPWLDIAAVVLPLGQAIGRIANYVNQELYGIPTTLPWGIQIESAFRVGEYRSTVEYPPETLFHPIWAYEAIWNLIAFAVLLWVFRNYRNRFKPGTIFLMYVVSYGTIRFLLEFLRIEVALLNDINTSQVGAALAVLIALPILVLRLRGVDGSDQRQSPKDEEEVQKATKVA